MAPGVHRDLGWNWEEATGFGRVRKAGLDDTTHVSARGNPPAIPIDWVPPKKLLEGLGRALSTDLSVAEASGLAEGGQDMHFG